MADMERFEGIDIVRSMRQVNRCYAGAFCALQGAAKTLIATVSDIYVVRSVDLLSS
jgi:hypothetical protein